MREQDQRITEFLRQQSVSDQAQASIRDMTTMIANFYQGLRSDGLDRQTALHLTNTLLSRLIPQTLLTPPKDT